MQVPFVPSTPFHHVDTLKQMKSKTTYSTYHFNPYFVTVIASPKHILADFNPQKHKLQEEYSNKRYEFRQDCREVHPQW